MEPALIYRWLKARSVERGLLLPVADHGGWRVDTNLPHELRRHVFAGPGPGLKELATSIHTPLVYLKMCGSEEEMRPLLEERWQFDQRRYFMTGEAFDGRMASGASVPPLPAGYSLQLYRNGPSIVARIVTRTGELAASGSAAEVDGVFIYDLIGTSEEHRRRGLGTQVMLALRSARRSPQSLQLLVATEAGHALYTTLGWETRCPYTTAHIPS